MPLERADPHPREEVQALLSEWVDATLARDASRYANLFLADHEAAVAWANGDVSHGWKAIHDHALRELYHAKVHVEHVDIDAPRVTPITDTTITTVFTYAVRYRDFWGTVNSTRRLATMTLLRTKDGLRIASAHFSKL